jgi:AraC-like DNA-binding protein
MYDQQCADLMQRRQARSGVSSQVRELLIHCCTASQADVAHGLNMSVRTLRRRLTEEGTTFRELSDETAGMLAEDLLHAGLSVEQVANRLGYSTASTFTVAFRSWRGQTPGQYARKRRQEAQ